MLKTNSEFLENELMDVIRAFDYEGEIVHYFSFHDNTFDNIFEFEGEICEFSNKQVVENDEEFKRFAKRFSKLAVYELLSKGHHLAWGALTGIRPTKLAYGEIEEGRDFVPLLESMHVSSENISLVGEVITAQKGIRAFGGRDLYISLPFCPSKCDYCSFITAPIATTRRYVESYIDALIKEIESLYQMDKPLSSIYIGGGTPFVLEVEQLERVYEAVKPLYYDGLEYTVEAGRPDVFSEEKLALSKKYNVNRICVNPQTFNDKTLSVIGRKHTTAETFAAFKLARRYGFIINLDLIAGLEGESYDDFKYSLERAIELDPENITVHTLSLKVGSKLREEMDRLYVEGIADMVNLSRSELKKNGYQPYYLYRQKYQAGGLENVGWMKKNFACKYNVNVMEEVSDNIALGAGAISKCVTKTKKILRLPNPKDIPTYINKVEKIIIERKQLFNF